MSTTGTIGLIAGDGDLPVEIAAEYAKNHVDFVVLHASQNEAASRHYPDVKRIDIRDTALKQAITELKTWGVQKLVFAGKVHMEDFLDKTNHFNYSLAEDLNISVCGNGSIFASVIHFVESLGFTVIGAHDVLSDNVCKVGLQGKVPLADYLHTQIAPGFNITKKIANLDIGQACIYEQNRVIGVEGVEGTDALMKRCQPYFHPGYGRILFKVSSDHQDLRIDIPVIGENTVRNMANTGIHTLVVETSRVLFVEKKQVLQRADTLGICIMAYDPDAGDKAYYPLG